MPRLKLFCQFVGYAVWTNPKSCQWLSKLELMLLMIWPVQMGQTCLSTIMQHCLEVLDCFKLRLNCVGQGSVQTYPTAIKDVATSGMMLIASCKEVFWSRKQKCWTMLDEKFELNQTPSKIIQHHPTPSQMH